MTGWSAKLRARREHFGLDVELRGGDSPLAVIGPNGSGKTTLLRLLAGAIPAEAEELRINNVLVASTLEGVHPAPEERNVGYVPQSSGLFPHLGVLDNVAFGLSTRRRKLPKKDRHRLAEQMLAKLGCVELIKRSVRGLSGGERQKVALARALVTEPQLLLLDEPMASLDVESRRSIREFLAARLSTFGHPAILVTHDVRDVRALGADVCVIECGRVVQCGSLGELRSAPASTFIAEFVDVELSSNPTL